KSVESEEFALIGDVEIDEITGDVDEKTLIVEPEPEPLKEDDGFVNFEILPDEIFDDILANVTRFRSTRIVYGSIASTNQFPYYAYLIIYRPGVSIFCGGTLITTQWLTTAAHCVRDYTGAQAYFGSINKNNMPVKITASGHYVHEDWDPSTLANDIALIKLLTAVPISSAINTVQLPPRSDVSKSYDGSVLVACGFGKTHENSFPTYLNYASINGISDYDCSLVHWVFKSTMLCAKGLNTGSSTCFGDSGGPLIYQSNGISKLVGINSFFQTEHCVNDVQGFTRVDKYLDWISAKTGVTISDE
ncbi:CLUMA_CG011947, isoform A, partial [Clunio marinus]